MLRALSKLLTEFSRQQYTGDQIRGQFTWSSFDRIYYTMSISRSPPSGYIEYIVFLGFQCADNVIDPSFANERAIPRVRHTFQSFIKL